MPRYFRDSLLVGADFDVDLISGSGVTITGAEDLNNRVARYTINATGATGAQNLVDVRNLGMLPATATTLDTDISAAFNSAIAASTEGQVLFFPFDATKVSSTGYCHYNIAAPLCITKAIPLICESRLVRLRLIGTNWGTTYFHAVRNWALVEGAYVERVDQVPDTIANPITKHYLNSLDDAGFGMNGNGFNGVSYFTFVHPHEQSTIFVQCQTGSGPNTPFMWGNRALSVFGNNDTADGTISGPTIYRMNLYGQGYDHLLYADGSNNGTVTGSNGWGRDFHMKEVLTPPSVHQGHYRSVLKSPYKVIAIDGFVNREMHCEATPYNQPPGAGTGGWQALTAYQAGEKLIVVSTSGANTGLAALAACTTAGTTGAGVPAWPSPAGNPTVNDGTTVWTLQTFGASSNMANANQGILDGMTPWPGSSIAVPKGMTISPDGTHGWVCQTAGTTNGGAQPAFSTAGGRGSTQADGTVTWVYFLDTFADQATFRMVDVSNELHLGCYIQASNSGLNVPLRKLTTTGAASGDDAVFQAIPEMVGCTIGGMNTACTGVATVGKGGWWGKIFTSDTGSPASLAWSPTFDPHRIIRSGPNAVEYLNSISLTPSLKLAAPSTYNPLFQSSGVFSAAAAAATKYFLVPGGTDIVAPGLATSQDSPFLTTLTAADLAMAGRTTKLRVSAICSVTTAPAVTITVGLYPVTVSGATLVLGTLVPGSTAAFVSPAGTAIQNAAGADFAPPADGIYALGYTVSGAPAGAGLLQARLDYRYV